MAEIGIDDALEAGDRPSSEEPPAEAKQLADDLEQMGPSFVKLGQLLSTRSDLVPPAWLDELARLQDSPADGFFHADPHPDNVFLTDDGRLALLDLGMVSRVAPEMQDLLVKLLLAVGEGQSTRRNCSAGCRRWPTV